MMTIEYSPFFLSGDIDFNVSFQNVIYQVTIKFFPFQSNKEKLAKTELKNINTPIAHITFQVLEVDKSIYRSFFLMSGQAVHIIQNLGNCNINHITKVIAREIGFEARIIDYIKSTESKNQLSLF